MRYLSATLEGLDAADSHNCNSKDKTGKKPRIQDKKCFAQHSDAHAIKAGNLNIYYDIEEVQRLEPL